MKKTLLYIFFLIPFVLPAQETEKLMLSGEGFGNTVLWDFYCSDGYNSKEWKKIEVPSNWELQGFGEYTYGRWYKNPAIKQPSQETGLYKYRFIMPASWKGRTIKIVFEGVMTDTEVKVNNKLAGAVHQGGFYRFSYDISDKVKLGQENLLEVKVSKHSSDKSVNAAERRARLVAFRRNIPTGISRSHTPPTYKPCSYRCPYGRKSYGKYLIVGEYEYRQ